MQYRLLDTPTGPFAVIASDGGDPATAWVRDRDDPQLVGARENRRLMPELVNRLQRYFAGEAVEFQDVPTPEGPEFHRRCWSACRTIERGSTLSYGELARLAGSGGAARAAGQAMRCNRLPIIIPCHRVLAANRRLGGFAGSANPAGRRVAIKRALLELEGALPAPPHLPRSPAC